MKKYILPVALCMLLGFSSCDDSLDLNPKDKVSEADYFKTAEDLELFSNPYYRRKRGTCGSKPYTLSRQPRRDNGQHGREAS